VYQQFTKNQGTSYSGDSFFSRLIDSLTLYSSFFSGVFSNPTSKSSPAKLRLAFEAAPFGMLVEKAGGKTSDGVTGGSILDVQINSVDQRTALCIGSKNEVDRFNEYLELKK
jgi:fructose-1,6-bisphosphatase